MTPRKGDKVRVTFEGTIFNRKGNETYVDPGPDRSLFRLPPNATVEVLEDLRPGDVYRSGRRTVGYIGTGAGEPWVILSQGEPSIFSTGGHVPDKYVERPLTLLVRDGKPVTP